jgi:molecular chaperone DnaJ
MPFRADPGKEYYEILGLKESASTEEIRKAYKREALKHHPDRNPGDNDAESKFKACNEAYQVLSDDEKRRIYDQFGHAGLEGGGGGFSGASDVFAHSSTSGNCEARISSSGISSAFQPLAAMAS